MRGLKPAGLRRVRARGLAGGFAVLLLVAACADVFGIHPGRPLVSGTAGGAGAGAAAGRSGRGHAGGSGASVAGGVGGEAGGGSGTSGQAGATGGVATAGNGGTGGDVGGAAGAAPVGGAGAPGPGLGTLGARCDDEGAYVCSDASPSLVLRCADGRWASFRFCPPGSRCDPASPGCAPIDDDCIQAALDGPVCKGSEVIDCSPELYTERHLMCPFGCRGGECVPGNGDQLTLHTGIQMLQTGRWRDDIPVCLAPAAPGNEAAVRQAFAWVRSEVENVWNRYLAIAFTGFGDCEDGATGVVVSFPEGCREHLVNDVTLGTAGAERAISLEICASYYATGAAEAEDTGEALTRLLARHQFGHVLGLVDGVDARETFMVRGVESTHASEIMPTTFDYFVLEDTFQYLSQHGLALATPGGACVGVTDIALGAGLALTSCRTSNLQHWAPPTGRLQLWYTIPEYCAGEATAGEHVALSSCELTGTPGDFSMPSVKWRTPAACVTTEASVPGVGTALVTRPCTDGSDPAQAWYFEILDSMGGNGSDEAFFPARIHHVATGLCVAVTTSVQGNSALALDVCTTTLAASDPQVFTLKRDQPWGPATLTMSTIRLASKLAINWQLDGGNLYAGPLNSTSAWFVSGPLVNQSGLALTQSEDGTLVAEPLQEPPPPNQVFDFYF